MGNEEFEKKKLKEREEALAREKLKEKEDKVNVEQNKKAEMEANSQVNKALERIKECYIENSPFCNIDKDYANVSKSICKLKIITRENQVIKGTGFFLRFLICGRFFKCLISNEHVINKDLINTNTQIYLLYDNNEKTTTIKLNSQERYIKAFIDNGLDITIVEILDKDNILSNYFLMGYYYSIIDGLIDNEICLIGYPKGGKITMSKGKLIKIDNYEFTHLASTEQGESGSPIFVNKCILGIHKESNKRNLENYGDFIYPAINIIKEDLRNRYSFGKYINGKYIYEDNSFYEGEFQNNMPNGEGKLYDKNGKIFYEGEFIKGKIEGKGKLIYDSHPYMICQFKNGSINGKGKVYDKNNNFEFEADFINDNIEGNIKIFKDNKIVIGQFKNCEFKGKFKFCDEKIIYEGEIIGKKCVVENVKFIMENGEYCIIPYKNNNLKFEDAKVYDEKGNYLDLETKKVLFITLISKLKEDKKCIIC